MTVYVYRNGARLTPYMYWQIERLNADVKRLFGVEVVVTSGIRLPQEQIDIFLQRYVTAGNIRGRKVYDTRVWNGVRYYRISSAGTVAVPSTSNHEIQGTNAAVDLRDTGRDGGLATWGSARSNWLRANAWRYGMEPEGFNFNEAWHYKMLNIFATPPNQPAGGGSKPLPKPKPKDDGMTQTVLVDKKHLVSVAKEFISHHGTTDQADLTRKIMSTQDELHKLSLGDFYKLMDGLGIPRVVIKVSAKFEVLNPQSGKFEENGVWSRERENASKLDRLLPQVASLLPKPDTTPTPK